MQLVKIAQQLRVLKDVNYLCKRDCKFHFQQERIIHRKIATSHLTNHRHL